MATFASLKPLLDTLSTDELISAGEYISQQLEKQLGSAADTAGETSMPTEKAKEHQVAAKPFPILELPRELRDQILFYAALSPSPQSTIHDGHKTYPQARLPALLHTNRQLRSEAAEPFFSQNTFVFWGDAKFGRLANLLAISGDIWNKFVKCVVLVPDGSEFRESPWDVYDPHWAAKMSCKVKGEADLGDEVVWTAMRRVGLLRKERWMVMGEVARGEDEENIEMVIG